MTETFKSLFVNEKHCHTPGTSLDFYALHTSLIVFVTFLMFSRFALLTCSTAFGITSTNDMALLRESKFKRVLEQVIPPMLEQEIPPMLKKVIPPMLEQMIPPMLHRSLSSPWFVSIPTIHGFLVKRKTSPAAGGGRSLQLCLMKGLPSTIFTHINIRAEDSSTLQVALCDATVLHSKVQLCVLRGDFESEDWTAEEFNCNIESPRQGKGPLLKGETSTAFEFIKEGRSEPIRVKDKRGVANQKPDRPSLDDKVSCLHKISKYGRICRQLSDDGIKTVKDLLRRHTTDQASLRQLCKLCCRKWLRAIPKEAIGIYAGDSTGNSRRIGER
ncbi:hypothetical protein Ahy_A06g027326 [Arachis hypogaea]|uniref:Uncharacterized protein n=1 Tax=Arachis hypogaea TaxID=3818 RepID=A0A445CNA3_ARAHY|nr:hypothetical protein Ahy_A06g027326 [Arachis hypogaea]